MLILLSTLGMMLLISADNLIALYLGLELMSLALYVMAAFARDDGRASEAGLKYFVLGALSSGMMLYGASLLYGFAGTVSFAGIADVVSTSAPIGVIFGLVFLLAGLAFKMSAAPFHMWTPDVYQGRADAGHRLLRFGRQDGGGGDHRARRHHRLPGRQGSVAPDRRLHLHRVDAARLFRGDRTEEHQAADGLFLDRPYGLRADRPRRRR